MYEHFTVNFIENSHYAPREFCHRSSLHKTIKLSLQFLSLGHSSTLSPRILKIVCCCLNFKKKILIKVSKVYSCDKSDVFIEDDELYD